MVRLLVIMLVVTLAAMKAEAETSRQALIQAIIQTESGGRDDAVGDKHLAEKAYGCLQIRQPCVDDVNRRYGTSYQAKDCLNNRKLSVWIFEKYMDMYATKERLGRNPTYQDMARIWNGGPNGCFDNGSINKFGAKPKSARVRAMLAACQKQAKNKYWEVKVEPKLSA